MVTTISPRRTTDMRVNEQFAGSSAELTQIRRASPASNTARFTAGTSVAVMTSQAPSRSAGANGRSSRVSRPGVGPGPDLVADLGGDDVHVGAGVEQRLDLAGGDPPGADHDAAPAGDEQVHRVPDAATGARCHAGALRARVEAHGVLLVAGRRGC